MPTSIKPKIFIRFFPGASGHFLASVIFSLCTPLDLKNPLSGHEIMPLVRSDTNIKEFLTKNTLLEDRKFLEENVQFNDAGPYPFFVIPSHVINPTALMFAFDNTKLINVKCKSDYFDQYIYNYVTKNPKHFTTSFPNVFLTFKKLHPNKLTNINLENIDEHNIRLISYIYKFGWTYFYNNWQNQSLDYIDNILYIEWIDLINKNLINKLDELAEFVGIELLPERRKNAIDLIIKYADAQQTCPWRLDINDYE